MPARPTMFDGEEMDALVAWCDQHGLDAMALFKTELRRMPTMWRDGKRAWWAVQLPRGQHQIGKRPAWAVLTRGQPLISSV